MQAENLWTHAAAFAGAQQFAFTCLALVGLAELLRVQESSRLQGRTCREFVR